MSVNSPFPLTDANGFWLFPSGANMPTGVNPTYGVSDFLAFYPQFGVGPTTGVAVVPENVIAAFVALATTTLQQVRWGAIWQIAVGWYVAHFCTLYLQTVADPDGGAAAVFEAGRAQGVIMSQSVGDVSIALDPNLAGRDQPSMSGWGAWHLTAYGQQLITTGRLIGKGGMQLY